MKKVKKAVIPAAGLGTRFLPASKTVPKELFPLVDRPLLLYIVEEAVSAGIEDIVIVSGRGKGAIEDFFDRSYELEDTLEKANRRDLLTVLEKIRNTANIISIRQKQALGLGHAVLTAAPVVGAEPFAVLLGDEIMIGSPSPTQELAQQFGDSGVSTVAVMEVERTEVSKYGIIAAKPRSPGKFEVTSVIEKPNASEAPSTLALPGRYVFDAKIFEHLKNTKPGKNGEIQLTDGMNRLAEREGLHASTFRARRYDAGDKFGFLQANIEVGLKHPETSEKLKSYLKELAREL